MLKVQLEDCQNIGKLSFIDWSQFKDSTVLITGSTGLIGSNLVNALAYNSLEKDLNVHIVLPVRNVERANEEFSWTKADIIPYTIGTQLNYEGTVDYIVHLASPTSSKFFTEKPVDTMLANIEGTKAVLEFAMKKQIRKAVYLSTMEVYGFPQKGHKVKENELGAFETMNARNSYPIAKIACEALCNSYFEQYDVPIVVMRATQTFGPGVKYNDGRVFAQFMRCVLENRNIVLKSEGLTERPYLYTADAVSAIINLLMSGKAGQSYTVANPLTLISIKDMASMVAYTVAEGQISVEYNIADNIEDLGYAKTLYMDLDTSKISELGWYPTVNLGEMFERMISGIEEERCAQ